jgi:hypothetical protein
VTEVLVLLSAAAHVSAHEMAITEAFRGSGVQIFGGRVLTARLPPEARARIAEFDDVEGVFEGPVPIDSLPDDPVGRIATEAWNARRRTRDEKSGRIGEGAAWDDPRFDPEGHQHGTRD